MEKSTYYVSVQAGTVLPDQGAAAYEFEIEASPKDANKLLEMMESKQNADGSTYIRSHFPGIPYHFDKENDIHDERLQSLYRVIHELGTEETKRFLEENQII